MCRASHAGDAGRRNADREPDADSAGTGSKTAPRRSPLMLSARIYAVTGDSGRPCGQGLGPQVEILPVGPQRFRRSSTPCRQVAHMRISLNCWWEGCLLSPYRCMGFGKLVVRFVRRGATGGRRRFAQAVAPLIFRNQYSCMDTCLITCMCYPYMRERRGRCYLYMRKWAENVLPVYAWKTHSNHTSLWK